MQYAYLLVILFYFFFWLYKIASRYYYSNFNLNSNFTFILFFSLARVLAHNFIQAKVILNKTLFINILFLSFDFKLTKKSAIVEKKNQIYRELSVYMQIFEI